MTNVQSLSHTPNHHMTYARSIGYTGKKPVRVVDGKVISHQNQDWSTFCERLREQSPDPSFDKSATLSPYPINYRMEQ